MRIKKRSLLAAAAAVALVSTFPISAAAQKKIVLGFSQVGAESELRTANTESGKTVSKRIVTEQGIFPMALAAGEFRQRKY